MSTVRARDDSSKERVWFSADSESGVYSKSCCPMVIICDPDWLRKIDVLLEDDAVIEARWPKRSSDVGRRVGAAGD